MSPENRSNDPKETEGERWLKLIGRDHLKGQSTGYEVDGRPVLTEEFDMLCGEHARPLFVGLETLNRNDPRYEPTLEIAQGYFDRYFYGSESD